MRYGKVISVYSDLRTRKGSLFFFVLGSILLVLTLLQFFFHLLSPADWAGSLVALTMLCFGAGAILYFFSRMFGKLAEIANEIENDESLRDDCPEEPTEEEKQHAPAESHP